MRLGDDSQSQTSTTRGAAGCACTRSIWDFGVALSRESEIPNLKALALSRCDRARSRVITRLGEVGKPTNKLRDGGPPTLDDGSATKVVLCTPSGPPPNKTACGCAPRVVEVRHL